MTGAAFSQIAPERGGYGKRGGDGLHLTWPSQAQLFLNAVVAIHVTLALD
jgi:hypothetical protein